MDDTTVTTPQLTPLELQLRTMAAEQALAERVQRWHETYNAYLPMAHQLACTTEDKVPRIMELTHRYALAYANQAHGEARS